MKKIMLIGKTGCGKTSFCQAVNDCELKYKKTQAIEIVNNAIDTPGEYLECKIYFKALVVTAVEADIIILLQACTDEQSLFPPGFVSMFSKPVIGIVTKVDLATDESQVETAENYLTLAGVGEIFRVSNTSKTGINEIRDYIGK
ncbi:MAG: EutP/PduV family microcompartment system protein [Eubacteriales bacterium]